MFKIGDKVTFNSDDDYYNDSELECGRFYNVLDVDNGDNTILIYSDILEDDFWIPMRCFFKKERMDKKKQFINNLCSK